jgi:hypothetical protein
MYTDFARPLNKNKIYRVTFVQVKTDIVFSILVDAPNSELAGVMVMESLGRGYELIQSRPTRRFELN